MFELGLPNVNYGELKEIVKKYCESAAKVALVALALSSGVDGKCLSRQGDSLSIQGVGNCSFHIPGQGVVTAVASGLGCVCPDYSCDDAVDIRADGDTYSRDDSSMVFLGKYPFIVADSGGRVRGPGDIFYSSNVAQGENASLHLGLGSEVISNDVFSYGKVVYSCELVCPGGINCYLPDHVTVSGFTFQFTPKEGEGNPHREVDMEIVNANPQSNPQSNAQFVVQPWQVPDNLYRIRISPFEENTVVFNILPESIEFCMAPGELSADECMFHPNARTWSYNDTRYIPQRIDGKDPHWRMVFNYWMQRSAIEGGDLSNQQRAQLPDFVVKSFEHTPTTHLQPMPTLPLCDTEASSCPEKNVRCNADRIDQSALEGKLNWLCGQLFSIGQDCASILEDCPDDLKHKLDAGLSFATGNIFSDGCPSEFRFTVPEKVSSAYSEKKVTAFMIGIQLLSFMLRS